MTVGHVYNHFILHTQQIFTLSLMVSLALVFGNFSSVKTSTIPTVYREEIFAISVTGMIVLLISVAYDLFGDIRSKFTIEEIFKDLKFWHHIICFIFVTVVVGIIAVYLNQGNIPSEMSIGIAVVAGLISVITFGVIIYCFNKTLSSRRNVYQEAIRKVNTKRQKALIG